MGGEKKLETHAILTDSCALTIQLPEGISNAEKLVHFKPVVDRFEECLTKNNSDEHLVRHERELIRLFLLWVANDGPPS